MTDNRDTLRSLIREVITQELAKLKAVAGGTPARSSSGSRVETVPMDNDADLQAFVRRLLKLVDDAAIRRAIESGELVFRLSPRGESSRGRAAGNAQAGGEYRLDKGVMTERDVERLPSGIIRIRLGRSARITPLAYDRARERRISVERADNG